MKRLIPITAMLSMIAMSVQAAPLKDGQILSLCGSKLEGLTNITVDAVVPPYAIVTYSEGELGGQKLLKVEGTCTEVGTDNSVFPLAQWKIPSAAVKDLALDQAKRWLKANKNVRVVDGEGLDPEQVRAYKALGVKVQ